MNTTANDVDASGRRYLDEAEAYLADLPARDRGELLSDIADAIAELGEAAVGDYDLLVARLGSPVEFAREIRRSAGGGGGLGGGSEGAPILSATAASGPAVPDVLPRAIQAGAVALRWTGRTFEPLWWLLRAFAVLSVLAIVFRGAGTGFLGGIGLAVLVASVVHGGHVRSDRSAGSSSVELLRGIGIFAVGAVALWFLYAVLMGVPFFSTSTTYDESMPASAFGGAASLIGPRGPIENIYAFDAQGNRLQDVRLYDQNGETIEIGEFDVDPTRRTPVDVTQSAAYNAFPVRYYDPGTSVIANPDAGWPASPGPLSGKVLPVDIGRELKYPEDPITDPVPDTLPSGPPAVPGAAAAAARAAALAAR